jgi:hypothetical protein
MSIYWSFVFILDFISFVWSLVLMGFNLQGLSRNDQTMVSSGF